MPKHSVCTPVVCFIYETYDSTVTKMKQFHLKIAAEPSGFDALGPAAWRKGDD